MKTKTLVSIYPQFIIEDKLQYIDGRIETIHLGFIIEENNMNQHTKIYLN